VRKITPTTTTVFAYDGANIIEETDSSGNAVARFEQGLNIDEPLAMLRSSATHFYNADGLGSVTSLTNGSGAVAASYTYDTFGNLASSTGSVMNPFRYTAREWDGEMGSHFYRARFYTSMFGRFVSEDPIGFAGGAVSFYQYAFNNPVAFDDPLGLQSGVAAPPAPAPPAPPPVRAPRLPTSRSLPVPEAGPASPGIGPKILRRAAVAVAIFLDYFLLAPSSARDEDGLPKCKTEQDCEAEWRAAREICRELLSRPNPPRALTGGHKDIEGCAKGFVSDECGGNPIDWGQPKPQRRIRF
jgi:RHS repeat-associated protein